MEYLGFGVGGLGGVTPALIAGSGDLVLRGMQEHRPLLTIIGLVGAVAFFPENYGNIIINMASNILQGKQTPPAVYTNHLLVLPEKTIKSLDLSQLNYEAIPVKNYEEASRQLLQRWRDASL